MLLIQDNKYSDRIKFAWKDKQPERRAATQLYTFAVHIAVTTNG